MPTNTSQPPISPISVFFPASNSQQPLRTPVKQILRVPSRPALTIKHMNTLPTSTNMLSAPGVVGVGTKRKSSNCTTPLHQRNRTFTPLTTTNTRSNNMSFDRLAPLPAPSFTTRTPHTKAETEVHLKTQTSTMTRLRISEMSAFDSDDDDSGCEVGTSENDTCNAFFLDSGKSPSATFQSARKGKGKGEEIVEAVSPDGHITKRRARARPLSEDLRGHNSPVSRRFLFLVFERELTWSPRTRINFHHPINFPKPP